MIRTGAAATSDRLEIISVAQGRSSSFADDVRAGLTASPKTLPSKYLYDAVGSALFDAITLLPEYYLTRAETEILHEWGWEIVRALGNPVEFIELGSGSAAKTRILIEEALRVQRTLRYSPIDISEDALSASARTLVDMYAALRVRAYAGDYFTVLQKTALRRDQRVLVMFMGSNIGNYDPAEAQAFVAKIAAKLQPGDGLLLGADLKKDAQTLELAYDDPAGVTAAFNKNLLARINRELRADFDLRRFEHVAKYEEEASRIKCTLVARVAHSVEIQGIGDTIGFAKDEAIHTESSYKYSPEDIRSIAEASSFRVERAWYDSKNRYSVNLLVKE